MKILVVEDEEPARYAMVKALTADGRQVLEAVNGEEGLRQIRDLSPDLVFLDLNMPGLDGASVLRDLQETPPALKPEIIVVTANNAVSLAVDCIRLGATDFITKPYDVQHIRSIAMRTQQRVGLQAKVHELQQSGPAARFGRLLGMSRTMRSLFRQIEKAAQSDLSILIRGESGTGKELIARELHDRSDRRDGPFVAVNTAAIATSLIESELFGHVRGAFTGAEQNREGVFRRADGGTLFLDEIGDMPADVQTRLLRVLQESVVQPVGTEQAIPINVRVVSATHQDLERAIEQKRFRSDLYFRLKGIELSVPPLRSRCEDILLIADSLLPADMSLSADATAALLGHAWPGNVRQLQQMIRSAITLCEDATIQPVDLGLGLPARPESTDTFADYLDLPLSEAKLKLIEDYERQAITVALDAESGNVSAAARRLGIHRQSLQQKMKSLSIKAKRS